MKKEFAHNFAKEWVEAWNSHDLNKVLSHYEIDFEMSSPIIKEIANESSGKLKGIEQVQAYWSKALEMNPKLHFTIKNIFIGANSIVLHYEGHRGLSAETFIFNKSGKVIAASAHYEAE